MYLSNTGLNKYIISDSRALLVTQGAASLKILSTQKAVKSYKESTKYKNSRNKNPSHNLIKNWSKLITSSKTLHL